MKALFEEISSQRITVKRNTLICAFTNGMHNRIPFPDSELTKFKQRKIIRIILYISNLNNLYSDLFDHFYESSIYWFLNM